MHNILNDTIKEYYLMVKYDLEDGADIELIQLGLKELEEEEDYLACAGVHLAMQEHLNRQIKEDKNNFDELINEIINGEEKGEEGE
jgi:hypothetical protein